MKLFPHNKDMLIGQLTLLYIKKLKTDAVDAACSEAARVAGAPIEYCIC
jgi:hypothetical protein